MTSNPGRSGHRFFLVGIGKDRRRGDVFSVVVKAVFVDVVEERGEAVVIALCDRIKFVVVTPRTFKSQSHDRVTKSIDSVGDIFRAPFRLDAAAFGRLSVKPAEGGGQSFLARCIRQQVARELFHKGNSFVRQIHDCKRRRPQSRYGQSGQSASF